MRKVIIDIKILSNMIILASHDFNLTKYSEHKMNIHTLQIF